MGMDYFESTTMNRDKWKFSYSVESILNKTQAKKSLHEERLAWWEAKKIEVMDKVKADGLEIDESLATTISNSYARGPQVQIRADLLEDLQECVGKIKEHRGKVEEFSAWEAVLNSQSPRDMLELNYDDYLFFSKN